MEVADAEAEAGRGLEAARGRVHPDGGGREGVVAREEECPPVLPVFVGRARRAGEDVVPFEDVGFGGVRGDVGGWVGLDGGVFAG